MKFLPHEDADYIIARRAGAVDGSQVFQVVKFTTGEAPASIHYITVTKKAVVCSCPAYQLPEVKKPCRHCIMVALWVLNGDKDPCQTKSTSTSQQAGGDASLLRTDWSSQSSGRK